MKKLGCIYLIILIHFMSLKAQLLPSIGINTQPANSATLCYPPYYTGSFYTSGYQVGNPVADFKLYNLQGDSLILSSELQNHKPVLLIAGSLTCPVFRGKVPTINQVMATYGSSINVFVIYTIEAHPTNISVYSGNVNVTSQNTSQGVLFPNPITYADRKQMVDTLPYWVSLNAPIFIDGPCNEWWNNFGPAPNNAYLIDTNGIAVAKHGWFHKLPIDDIFCDIDNYLGVTSGSCVTTTAPGHFTIQVLNSISYGSPTQTLYDFVNVINTQSVPVTVSAKKIQQVLPTNWESSFCADVCYSTLDDSVAFVVNPFDTLLFSLDFYTGPSNDSGKVRVGFRNVNDISNGVPVWLKASTYPTTHVLENELLNTPVFYPNPSFGNLSIAKLETEFKVEVYNSLGQLMLRERNIYEINTAGWPPGMYTLHYQSDRYNITRKAVFR